MYVSIYVSMYLCIYIYSCYVYKSLPYSCLGWLMLPIYNQPSMNFQKKNVLVLFPQQPRFTPGICESKEGGRRKLTNVWVSSRQRLGWDPQAEITLKYVKMMRRDPWNQEKSKERHSILYIGMSFFLKKNVAHSIQPYCTVQFFWVSS